MSVGPDGVAAPPGRKGPSRAVWLGLGLVLTLGGLFLVAGGLPSSPITALLAAGVAALWFGGLVLGLSRRR